MTTKLKTAFKKAETLPASDQDELAKVVVEKVEEMQKGFSDTLSRLSEDSLTADKDAPYEAGEKDKAAPYSSLDVLLNARLSGPADASVTYEELLYGIPKDDQ